MVDEGLHRGVELLSRRQHDLAVVRDPRHPLQTLEPVEALAHDLCRLRHLFHAHAVAVVDVAVRVDRNLEVDLVVVEVRLVTAQVPVDTRGAQVRARLSESDRVLRREDADSTCSLEPDLVPVEDAAVVVERARHPLHELAAFREEAPGDVLGQPADLEVAGVHPLPRDELEQVEDRLPLAEAVPEHRDRPQLERGRAEEDEVRVDPVQLAQEHPHPVGLGRHLELEQLLDRQHEDELVVLVPDVVDPLREGDALPVRLRLHRLLEARVEVADHRRDADDLLAVQVDDQA